MCASTACVRAISKPTWCATTSSSPTTPAAAEQEVIDFAPLKRIATPGEVATAIVYLASDDARFITGSALQIDGGSTAGR
jgi:NAD(P)-dependent dehydrogenase (short-subunit alcohol dehydrogenase family)